MFQLFLRPERFRKSRRVSIMCYHIKRHVMVPPSFRAEGPRRAAVAENRTSQRLEIAY